MATYDKEKVKEQLETENILDLLEFFDAQPQMMDEYIVCRTICHGGDTHKLYYYENTQLFKCYTGDCGSFDVFELIQKVQEVNLSDAVYFIVNFFNLYSRVDNEDYSAEDRELLKAVSKWKIDKPQKKQEKVEFAEIPDYIKHYPQPRFLNWERDGISDEVCRYMGIRYDPVYGTILIPHKDENNRLIGIRQRTLVQEDEIYGKYRPAKLQGKLCNHPLAFNLYGLNVAADNIKRAGRAFVFESEKSVLQYMSYFGIEETLAVAVCGSSLSKYQADLLHYYGAREIVIGFDKDFKELNTEEHFKSNNKLKTIHKKFNQYGDISFLYDRQNNLLEYKASPTEGGKEAFLYMWEHRLFLEKEDYEV